MQHIFEFYLELNRPEIDKKENFSQEEIKQKYEDNGFKVFRDRYVTESSRMNKVSKQIVKELSKLGSLSPEDKITNFYLAQIR